MPEGSEGDRFDAQRKALSGLLARFTADRDALITSVRECEQQLSTIAARLDAAQTRSSPVDGAPCTDSTPQLDTLRQLIEQVQFDQRQALTQARATAEHAMQRANEALQSIHELTTARDQDTGELLARFTADRDAVITSVRECEQQLAAISARLDATQANRPAPTSDSSAVIDVAQLAELKTLIEQMQRDQRQTEALVHAAREQTAQRTDEAFQQIKELADAQRAHEDGTREVLTHLVEERDAYTASLQQLQSVVEQIQSDQLRSEAHFRSKEEELVATLAEADKNTREMLARLTADLERLSESDTQVATSLARLEASQGNGETAIQQLQRVVGELQNAGAQTTATAERAVLRADEAAKRMDAALGRMDAYAADQHTRDTNGTELGRQLAAEREALAASIRETDQRLGGLIERLQVDQRQAEAQTRISLEGATRRAEEALRRVQELAVGQRDSKMEMTDLSTVRSAVDRVSTRLQQLESQVARTGESATSSRTRQPARELIDRVGRIESELKVLRENIVASRETQDRTSTGNRAELTSAASPGHTDLWPHRSWLRPALAAAAVVLIALGVVGVTQWQLAPPRSVLRVQPPQARSLTTEATDSTAHHMAPAAPVLSFATTLTVETTFGHVPPAQP